LADNPRLTTRLPDGGRDPLRIIIDSSARTPLDAEVVINCPERTLLIANMDAPEEKISALQEKGIQVIQYQSGGDGHIPLGKLMDELGHREISSVLVEGGSTLNYSLLAERLVDKVHFFIAPLLFGGRDAPSPVGGDGVFEVSNAWLVNDVEINSYGSDLLVTGYIQNPKE